MENEEDPLKKQRIIDTRARNISHNVRCLECGSQSIEESKADIAVILRKGMMLEKDRIRNPPSIRSLPDDVIVAALLSFLFGYHLE